jgi:plastocyanin
MDHKQLLRRGAMWMAGAVATTALLAGCGGASEGTDGPAAADTSSQPAAATTVKVVMKDNLFEPKAVTIPAGKEVTIEYENAGAVMHNLVAGNFSSPMVQAGEKGTMKVKFDKAEQVKFLCAFHQPGMEGMLTVKAQ